MATAFDVTTYPLDTQTGFKMDLGTRVNRAADGTPTLRVMKPAQPASLRCIFMPQTQAASQSFWTYLVNNRATEFDIVHNGRTYRGYIDGETLEQEEKNGVWQYWAFNFEAIIV